MNNKKLIPVIVLALILLLVGFLLAAKANTKQNPMKTGISNETSPSTEQSAQTIPTPNSNQKSSTLADLLSAGTTQKCAFSDKTINGTTYISNKNMRGDYQVTTSDGKTMDSHIMYDGTWFYAWGSATSIGVKMKTDTLDPQKIKANGQNTSDLAALANTYSFNCGPWVEDNSVFTLPTNVTFTDLSQVLNNAGTSACSACDLIQDANAKAVCKTRLGCK